MPLIIVKLYVGSTVAVNTPAHAQFGKLTYFGHFLYWAVTGLALYLAYFHMLGVVKVNMVGKIVDLNPFDWLSWPVITFFSGFQPAY